MHLEQKSPELIQAQLAAFAAEHEDSDKRYLFEDLGELAMSKTLVATRVLKRDEFIRDGDGNYIRTPDGLAKTPKGTKVPVAEKEDYVGYLRSVDGSRHEAVQERMSLLEAYKQFEPEITELIRDLSHADSPQNHPDYLGSGLNTSAFLINHDGKKYVVRSNARQSGENRDAGAADYRARTAVLAKGIPHFEQFVAMSYDSGIVVSEVMPGKEMTVNMPLDDFGQVSDEQLADFVGTMVTANKRGIGIDPKPSNIFYDTKEGFGIIDYNIANRSAHFGEDTGYMVRVFQSVGSYGGNYLRTSADEYANSLKYLRVALDVTTRYREQVAIQLKGVDRTLALEIIDGEIRQMKDTIASYSDPTWVQEQVKKNLLAKEEASKQKPGSWASV